MQALLSNLPYPRFLFSTVFPWTLLSSSSLDLKESSVFTYLPRFPLNFLCLWFSFQLLLSFCHPKIHSSTSPSFTPHSLCSNQFQPKKKKWDLALFLPPTPIQLGQPSKTNCLKMLWQFITRKPQTVGIILPRSLEGQLKRK